MSRPGFRLILVLGGLAWLPLAAVEAGPPRPAPATPNKPTSVNPTPAPSPYLPPVVFRPNVRTTPQVSPSVPTQPPVSSYPVVPTGPTQPLYPTIPSTTQPDIYQAFLIQQQQERDRLDAYYRRNLELIQKYPYLAGYLDLPPRTCETTIILPTGTVTIPSSTWPDTPAPRR